MKGSASSIGFTARGKDSGGYIRFQFTDMHGKLRNVQIPPGRSVKALNSSLKIDGSSIPGLSPVNNSDMRIVPDRATHQKIWIPSAGQKNREIEYVICDIYDGKGKPSALCPRNTLINTLDNFDISEDDVALIFGAELEFFLFQQSNDGSVNFETDRAGYYYSMPEDELDLIREEMVHCLSEAGIMVESSHHEVSSSQHEITLSADNALAMADKIVIAKWIIKSLAASYGLIASFMPKPFSGHNGSGLHLHQSIFSNDHTKNLYYSSRNGGGLSNMGKHAIAGMLKHADSICAFTNPTVNSYKRLLAGYEAPIVKAWGNNNRSAMIRVPSFDSWKNARVEFRLPDSSANPYLAINAISIAVLEGIKGKLPCQKECTGNIFDSEDSFSDSDFAPSTLGDAISHLLQDSDYLKNFNSDFIDVYTEEKMNEIGGFMEHVSELEVEKYLEI